MSDSKVEPATEPIRTCPYTGTPFEVEFIDKLSAYRLKGGFDPSQKFGFRKDLLRFLQMRNGVEKAVGPANMRCPYLGSRLKTAQDDQGMWYVVGDYFTPRALFSDRTEMWHAVSRRNGVEPSFPSKHSILVTELEQVSDPTLGLGGSNDAVEEGLDILLRRVK